MKTVKISASLLSADFAKLGKEIKKVDKYVYEYHIDVMDGRYVPNITMGPAVIKSIRKYTKKPLDVHLMVENPISFVDMFADAGADMITFPYKTEKYLKCRDYIKSKGVKAGVAYNPDVQLYILDSNVDRVLIMSVYPGFAGQKFIDSTLEKVREARNWIDERGYSIEVAVDGGINKVTGCKSAEQGADVLVSASYIFKGNSKKNVSDLRKALQVCKKKEL